MMSEGGKKRRKKTTCKQQSSYQKLALGLWSGQIDSSCCHNHEKCKTRSCQNLTCKRIVNSRGISSRAQTLVPCFQAVYVLQTCLGILCLYSVHQFSSSHQ